MKITIAAVGRMKPGPEREIVDSYLKRIPWQVVFKEAEEKKQLPPEKLKEKEAELLLAAAPSGAKKIILDEKGREFTSEEFAALLTKWNEEAGHVAFFIGGADGHGKLLKEKADFSISLGKMTWPHMLVRSMLSEQLYRAYTIMSKHPYHRK